MNKKNLYIQPIFLLFLFLIIVFCGLRFLWLDRFPIGISHDEIEYILSSKTYFLKGVDLSGASFPISIFKTKTEGIISFLVPILLSPYYGPVNINQFTSRLPYVLLSLATIYILFLLVKKLFNKQIALISVIVFLLLHESASLFLQNQIRTQVFKQSRKMVAASGIEPLTTRV